MSKKTRSVGLNFEIVFDKDKETWIQRVKRWCSKQAPPFNLIFLHLFSIVEKWYIDSKIELEMDRVDKQAEQIRKQWDREDAPQAPVIVEKESEVEGLPELSISNPVVEKRASHPLPDPWDTDWNDAAVNYRRWLDKDSNRE